MGPAAAHPPPGCSPLSFLMECAPACRRPNLGRQLDERIAIFSMANKRILRLAPGMRAPIPDPPSPGLGRRRKASKLLLLDFLLANQVAARFAPQLLLCPPRLGSHGDAPLCLPRRGKTAAAATRFMFLDVDAMATRTLACWCGNPARSGVDRWEGAAAAAALDSLVRISRDRPLLQAARHGASAGPHVA